MIADILSHTTWIEWLGVAFSLIQVILARNNNPSNYLFGIAGIILTLIVMFKTKLYAEFTLNIYYLIMSIYGWALWLSGKSNKVLPISICTKNDWFKVIAIVIISFTTFAITLHHYTNSDVPIVDALVSAFAWAGMWLMAKRKLENWILLNISNIIAIPLMIHKHLYLYAALSVCLFIVAVFGFINWKKIMNTKKPTFSIDEK